MQAFNIAFDQYFYRVKQNQKMISSTYDTYIGMAVIFFGWIFFEFILTKFLIALVTQTINRYDQVEKFMNINSRIEAMIDIYEQTLFLQYFNKPLKVYIHFVKQKKQKQMAENVMEENINNKIDYLVQNVKDMNSQLENQQKTIDQLMRNQYRQRKSIDVN